MPNIKLKNASGEEVIYNGISAVRLKNADAQGTVAFVHPSDATATETEILSGYTAYVADGTKADGGIENYDSSLVTVLSAEDCVTYGITWEEIE